MKKLLAIFAIAGSLAFYSCESETNVDADNHENGDSVHVVTPEPIIVDTNTVDTGTVIVK
ncbi:MAG: hypothetical protein M3Q97_03010 [Bacteroidota bacterium]|nr:hypothetical protein [Bacteroidota bacterium]